MGHKGQLSGFVVEIQITISLSRLGAFWLKNAHNVVHVVSGCTVFKTYKVGQ